MNTKSLLRNMLILSVICCNIGCDQVSKKIVRDNIAANEIVAVIDNHFIVMHVENTGAFLSLGDSLPKPVKDILLSLLPVLALSFGLVYVSIKQNLTGISLLGLCSVLGGGIANIFDRIAYGSVTDFLHIDFGIFKTGIFNVADVSITAGALLLMMHSLFKKYKTGKTLT
jgi:signal peptidase II